MTSTELSNSSASNSLEGAIISGRGLTAYEHTLGFRAELLRGGTVLNFGPGLTHLEQQLGERGIPSTVVNLDIIKELYISAHDAVRYGATLTMDVYAGLMEKFGKDTTKLRALQKSFVGVKDKTFVQYDGRKIPFADGSFDHVLALWSTYQIPAEQREGVYRELMRVGKHIHIGPIGKVDFAILMRLAQTQGFDVVACMPTYGNQVKRLVGKGIQIKTSADYDGYIRNKPASKRIATPLIDDLTFTMPGINTKVLRPVFGGSTIILKKRSDATMGEMMENAVYVGVGKPDGLPAVEPFDRAQGEAPLDRARGETHPVVVAVKKTLGAWWERVGPGGVEKSWVNAHKNILANIKETERFAAFEKTAETWRKVGKALGIASTVVDFSLSGVGLVVMGKLLLNPAKSESDISDVNKFLAGKVSPFYAHWYERILVKNTPVLDLNTLTDTQKEHLKSNAFAMVNVLEDVGSYALGGVSAGIALGAGPAHITWSLGAKVAEFFGVALAKAENYVGTGKAAQHAEAVGEVLDKGFTVIAKNPEIVPEKYRKTVEIIAEASEKEEQARKAADLQRRIQEKANFQREHQAWMDDMDPGLQSYYKLRGEWPPSTEEFAKAREGFRKDLRKQEESKRG